MTTSPHPITGLSASDHIAKIRDALANATGIVHITLRRGGVLTVAADELDMARTSVVVGFKGRFAYGGIDSVDVVR